MAMKIYVIYGKGIRPEKNIKIEIKILRSKKLNSITNSLKLCSNRNKGKVNNNVI